MSLKKMLEKIMFNLKKIILLLLIVCSSCFVSPTFPEVPNNTSYFIQGVDISSVIALEKSGAYFENSNGIKEDIFKILSNNNINAIRIRLWHNPRSSIGINGGGMNDIDTAIKIAKRAKQYNMKVLLNFHYSDTWADPSKQYVPQVWQSLDSIEDVKTELYNYTKSVLETFKNQGIGIDYVQIGNEINAGILWHNDNQNDKRWGKLVDWKKDMSNFISLINEGIAAVREISPNSRIILHIAKPIEMKWFFPQYMDTYNVDYDIMGVSYYPFFEGYGDKNNLKTELDEAVKLNNKDIMIMEYSYAYTLESHLHTSNIFNKNSETTGKYSATVEGQKQMIRDTLETIKDVQDNRGIGLGIGSQLGYL